MIKEAYCSFEVAKLLKEKGFDERCHTYFISDDEVAAIPITRDFNNNGIYLSAPTQQMAMAYLREVHNLHITIMFSKYLYGSYPFFWDIDGMIDDKREKTSTDTGDYSYKSYEEAVEAAIKYCLENLV